jgi:hypothetical protein
MYIEAINPSSDSKLFEVSMAIAISVINTTSMTIAVAKL